MYYKLTLKIFLFILFTVVLIFLTALFLYDPLKILHKPLMSVNYTFVAPEPSEEYVAVKFLIENVDFDSVIIGSSLSTNISAVEVSKKMGGKFLNLSIDSSNPDEQKYILKYLFRRKPKVKKVVYFAGLCFSPDIYNPYSNAIDWKKLYDYNPFNDVEIYFYQKYIDRLLRIKKQPLFFDNVKNDDVPFEWFKKNNASSKLGGYSHWLDHYEQDKLVQIMIKKIAATPIFTSEDYNPHKFDKYIKVIEKYYEKNLIYFVKAHPETTFYVVIPPMSTLSWAQLLHVTYPAFIEKETVRFLVLNSIKYKNLKIYFFDNLPDMGNIEDYIDLLHFSPRISEQIINSVAKDKNILTPDKVDPYFDTVIERANNYNFRYYVEKARETVAKNR